jgi:DNA recombination protein RmuC
VVELAGMMEHCDFEVQTSFAGDGGRLRPDLVINLPDGQSIVVDAKAPTAAYREAVAEVDPVHRQAKLKEHAGKVRGHILDLGSKEYWARLPASPEYVVLFLPGDSFLSAAIESDPSIMDDAIRLRVLLATPMTLIALLKGAHSGWNREAISRNAEEISRAGRELYDRVATFADHLGASAKNLSSAVNHFNKAIGAFELRIVPQALKLAELGAKGAKELGEPEHIEVEVRDVAKRA